VHSYLVANQYNKAIQLSKEEKSRPTLNNANNENIEKKNLKV